jgi:histidinol-phosphatase (PHP family)
VIVDYHVHTPYCGHAHGKMIDYVECAIKAGMSEIGFSDHLGRYYLGRVQKKRYWDWGMSERDLARYFDEVMSIKEIYAGRMIIRCGLEIDFIEGAEHLVENITANYPFDYLLGSIHCIPALGWHHLSQYSRSDPEKIYKWYFPTAEAAIRSGLFQSIAHLDFVWRYVVCPESWQPQMEQYITDIVTASINSSTDIEINANGFILSRANYPKGFDPFDLFLSIISAHKAKITLGSDAHAPQMVAKFFPEMIQLLQSKGIFNISIFKGKKKESVVLG